jgi:hypothetical protein
MGLVHLPSKAAVLVCAKSEVGLSWTSVLAAKSGNTFIHLSPDQKNLLLQPKCHLSLQSKMTNWRGYFKSSTFPLHAKNYYLLGE